MRLTVNGKRYELDIPPSKLLLDVIREDLGLTGTKYGCGTGECGVCTVLFDGKPVTSCTMLVAQAKNHEITTIEGIRDDPLFRRIEDAFIAKGAVQCGYCTPGTVLTAFYFLKTGKKTREEIRKTLSAVSCRCGCYQKAIDAIESIVKGKKLTVDPSTTSKVVGKKIGRVDIAEKIEGKAIYTVDLKPLKNSLFLKFARSPYAFAKIEEIDTKKAEKVEGVELILTHKNVPDVKFTTAGQSYPEPSPYDTKVLNDTVRYYGEPVAVVAASSEEIAAAAIELIEVKYRPLTPVFDPKEALKDDIKVHPEGNVVAELHTEVGDVDKGFKEADFTIEREYETQIQKHIHLEPYASFSYWDGDKIIVETGSQVVFHCRRILSKILGLPMNRIIVRSRTIGGGFGDRQEMTLEHYVALVTLKTGKPAWASLTREEQFFLSRRRHNTEIKVKIGAKSSGELTAISMEALSDTGAYGSHAPTVAANIGSMTLPLYTKVCKNIRFDAKAVYTNKPIAGALRGYGTAQGGFALESAMDELAELIGMDPIDLRLRNLIEEGDIDPISEVLSEGGKAMPRRINSCGITEALIEGRKIFGWDKKIKEVKEGMTRGMGVACAMKGSGVAGFELASSLAKLNEDGTVVVTMGASDIGQGAESAIAQIAAQAIGVDLDDIRVVAADTERTLFDMGTYACSVTYVTGEAVRRAGEDLKKKVIKYTSKLMGETEGDLGVEDGRAYVKKDPSKFVTLKDVATEAVYKTTKEQLIGIGSAEDLLSPPPFTAHFVQVAVDRETGKVEIERYLDMTDIGTVINPMAAEGQMEGQVAQGIGYALFEEVILDKEGKITNPDLTNYKIASSMDVPDVETEFIKTYEPTGPFGAKGAGEVSLVAVAPALANAIYNATGMRFRRLPITRERIALKGGLADEELAKEDGPSFQRSTEKNSRYRVRKHGRESSPKGSDYCC
jgi:CO/xanthine dehydrogenase Mo-binding subunit/aerobic-type carbon monoxide dehydrogenase small subunit (CoxS/CutS family)